MIPAQEGWSIKSRLSCWPILINPKDAATVNGFVGASDVKNMHQNSMRSTSSSVLGAESGNLMRLIQSGKKANTIKRKPSKAL